MSQNGVLFGVDYYPEQWEKSLVEKDIVRIKEFGFRAVRLMEFAWALLEPTEGRFDFAFFDEVIEKFHAQGIKVVLGTPTATFPIWLYEKDPELVQLHPTGARRSFGVRRQPCYNNKAYREAAARIVEAVARHYGGHPSVIGWQVDNEIGHEGSDVCVCENCRKAWHRWLETKYGDIGELNRVWGTVFWGTTYREFHEIPLPKAEIASIQNPTLFVDYYRFSSDAAVHFAQEQARVLREHSAHGQWVTTNLYPTPHAPVIDMEELTRGMEFASFDNYPIWGDQDEPLPYFFVAYMLSYTRGLRESGKYAVMEQFTGIQGHVCLGALPKEEQVALWTNQAVARGADTIFYFRWRTARFGQEQLCYGIFDSDNSDTARAHTLRENMRKHGPDFARFANTPVTSQACLVYEKDNARLAKDQYLSKGLYHKPNSHMQVGYDLEMARSFAPFVLFNVNADVKSAKTVDLNKYKLISLPLYQMTDANLVDRLTAWVREGGHLVLGFRTGTRDEDNFAVEQELPGLFRELAGIKVKRFESLNNQKVKIRVGLFPGKGETWADLIEPVSAKPLAYYTDAKKHYRGTPCLTVNDYGKGKVYYLGIDPDPMALFFIYRKILKDAGLNPKFYGQGVEVVQRETNDGRTVKVILNHTPKAKRVGGVKVGAYGMVVRY